MLGGAGQNAYYLVCTLHYNPCKDFFLGGGGGTP